MAITGPAQTMSAVEDVPVGAAGVAVADIDGIAVSPCHLSEPGKEWYTGRDHA